MRLVADANVLLSAVIGGRGARVLVDERIERIFTAAVTIAEVQEYASHLARRKRLPLDLALMTAATLPVVVVERMEYQASVGEAQRRIGHRDPDDVDLLALALHLNLPVWSNDNDFEDAGIDWFTTARLIAALER